MRQHAMICAVKDSLLAAVIFASGLGLNHYTQSTPSEPWVVYTSLGLLGLACILLVNLLAALGATALMGGSYHAKKSELSMRVALFHSDKHSSGLKLVKIGFFYVIGVVVYPFAVFITLTNLKSVFAGNKSYDAATAVEKQVNAIRDEADHTVKTADKKWKLSKSPFDHYYFHTYKEAVDFALANNINEAPKQLI